MLFHFFRNLQLDSKILPEEQDTQKSQNNLKMKLFNFIIYYKLQ